MEFAAICKSECSIIPTCRNLLPTFANVNHLEDYFLWPMTQCADHENTVGLRKV